MTVNFDKLLERIAATPSLKGGVLRFEPISAHDAV